MERRTALAAAVAGAATLATASVTLAAVGAIDILGFRSPRVAAGATDPVVVKQIETVDSLVVIPSMPTAWSITSAAGSGAQRFALVAMQPVAPASGSAAPSAASGSASPYYASGGQGAAAPAASFVTLPASPDTAPPPTSATTKPAPSTAAPTTGAPTTTRPPTTTAPPTTAAPTTTPRTTLPPGVPADWPKDKPIPPMPAGCQNPQLEDNGVWNCEND